MNDAVILRDDEDVIEFDLGRVDFEDARGYLFMQKDYRVKGEIWQVHKGDADPFPSRPHAHCIDGRGAYSGGKLHLGTRELFQGARSTGLFYPEKNFIRLCSLIQPKFPGLKLPLAD